MVEIRFEYEGELHCKATHGPSGAVLTTDAPVDNHGRGASFSPTDLLATSLGACMVTVMGIAAQKRDWSLEGTRASVKKTMSTDGPRRVARLDVEIEVYGEHDERARETLVRAAHTCPVHQSLSSEVEVNVDFRWRGAAVSG